MTPKQRRTFGRALKVARADAGHTQLTFSRVLGVDPVTVSRWERGESAPNRWLMPALVAELPAMIDAAAITDATGEHSPSGTGTEG